MNPVQEQKEQHPGFHMVPYRSTNWARQCLTSLSRREAVLSLWCGRSGPAGLKLCTLMHMYPPERTIGSGRIKQVMPRNRI